MDLSVVSDEPVEGFNDEENRDVRKRTLSLREAIDELTQLRMVSTQNQSKRCSLQVRLFGNFIKIIVFGFDTENCLQTSAMPFIGGD